MKGRHDVITFYWFAKGSLSHIEGISFCMVDGNASCGNFLIPGSLKFGVVLDGNQREIKPLC